MKAQEIDAAARRLVEAHRAVRQEMALHQTELRRNSQMPSWPEYEAAQQAWMKLPFTVADQGISGHADSERLDWLDSLPNGISVLGDAVHPMSMGMTPKQPGFSHTRWIIDEARRQREAIRSEPGPFKNNDHEHDGA